MGIRQKTFLDYDGFVEKFNPKRTTDDCYTPENVYNVVRDWAVKEYALDRREIVRPFWPGADFETADYPDGCVVIDNPPFSILARIVHWFNAQKIDYFLFSPYLTNLGIQDCNHVIAPHSVTYANGAQVATSFVTSLGEWFIRAAPDLMDAVKSADKENRKATTKALPKYIYPDCIITSAAIGYLCTHHTPFAVKRSECAFVRKLDAMYAVKGVGIFGGGICSQPALPPNALPPNALPPNALPPNALPPNAQRRNAQRRANGNCRHASARSRRCSRGAKRTIAPAIMVATNRKAADPDAMRRRAHRHSAGRPCAQTDRRTGHSGDGVERHAHTTEQRKESEE